MQNKYVCLLFTVIIFTSCTSYFKKKNYETLALLALEPSNVSVEILSVNIFPISQTLSFPVIKLQKINENKFIHDSLAEGVYYIESIVFNVLIDGKYKQINYSLQTNNSNTLWKFKIIKNSITNIGCYNYEISNDKIITNKSKIFFRIISINNKAEIELIKVLDNDFRYRVWKEMFDECLKSKEQNIFNTII